MLNKNGIQSRWVGQGAYILYIISNEVRSFLLYSVLSGRRKLLEHSSGIVP